MSSSNYKKIICIDFDGVIHSYERGWQGGELYGTVTEGFFEWAEEASKKFKLVVYSSRSSQPEFASKMEDWLRAKWMDYRKGELLFPLEFSDKKPPAWITIDDRCIQFRGHWDALSLRPETIEQYKPWNVA